MEIVKHIASIPLFEDLPKEQQEDLAMIVADQVYKRGQTIFTEGDDATGFYVGITGRVKIFKLSFEGKEQILHIFGPGEPFGEVPVFTGQHFPANAEAMEDGRIFFFFTHLIDDLSLKEVPGRLSAYLLYLSEQKKGTSDLELTITKSQLASLLGTIPETLSRIFGKMSKQVRILDRQGLEDLAETGGRF
jgi:CRP/FNR family transcriptional regulator